MAADFALTPHGCRPVVRWTQTENLNAATACLCRPIRLANVFLSSRHVTVTVPVPPVTVTESPGLSEPGPLASSRRSLPVTVPQIMPRLDA
jgi:hypothetical protein